MSDDANGVTINTDLVRRMVASADRMKSAALRYSSDAWDLVSITNLNKAFARQMVSSGDRNMEATTAVDEGLREISRATDAFVEEIEMAVVEITDASEPFQSVQSTLGNFSQALREMERHFKSVQRAFDDVGSAVEGIGETVSAIENVASLTNLLALNAAIQAARAGEHGKGFRVVATEVKNLAEGSDELTSKITELLAQLKSSIEETTSGLGSFGDIRDELDERAREAVAKLAASDASLILASDRMTEVNALVKQQHERVGDMTDRVNTLRQSVQGVSESSHHILDNLVTEEQVMESLGSDDTHVRQEILDQSGILESIGIISNRKKTLVVGHDLAYPPWCYVSEGRSAGLSIDIMQLMGDALDMSISFQPRQFSDVLSDFKAGGTQIILNAGWPNPLLESAGAIPTVPYADFEPVIFVRSSDQQGDPRDPQEFTGSRLAFQIGSYTEFCMAGRDVEMVPVENDIQGIASLIWGEVDGVATERLVGEYISKRFFHGDIVVGSGACQHVDVVMALSSKDIELRDRINAILSDSDFLRKVGAILSK